MGVIPNSVVQLITGVPFTAGQQHSIDFDNIAAQDDYFSRHVAKTYTDATYIRSENVLALPDSADYIRKTSAYIRYKNTEYGDKWIYAFIADEPTFKSPAVCWVRLKIDVIQTYLFSWDIKSAFIERQHAKNDDIADMDANRADEGINVESYKYTEITENWGDYRGPASDPAAADNISTVPLIALNKLPKTAEVYSKLPLTAENRVRDYESTPASFVNGLYNGVFLFFAGFKNGAFDYDAYKRFINWITASGGDGYIYDIFNVPRAFIDEKSFYIVAARGTGTPTLLHMGYLYKNFPSADAPYTGKTISTKRIEMKNTFSFSPKNTKMFCYPFSYFLLVNNQGEEMTIRHEDCLNDFASRYFFGRINANIAPDCTVTFKILDKTANYNAKFLTIKGMPHAITATNSFSSWLATSLSQVAISFIPGAAYGSGSNKQQFKALAGAPSEIASGILPAVAEIGNAAKMPNQTHGQLGSSTMISQGKLKFQLYEVSAVDQRARQIDNFFTAYGYKVNEMKKPEFRTRARWNYHQMKQMTIGGNIPASEKEEIKTIFSNGITFWHCRPDIPEPDVGNYELNNPTF